MDLPGWFCYAAAPMHIEQLVAENVRHLDGRTWTFAVEGGAIRKWTLLPAEAAAPALLRCLALAGMGRRQMDMVRLPAAFARQLHQTVRMEWVQIRHALQERGESSPARRHVGWQIFADGRTNPLPQSAVRLQDRSAHFGRPDSGKSNAGRLLLGYGKRVRAHAGTDDFGIYPDQRLKRCAGLFDGKTRCTDPLAFLRRLHFKGRYRAGRARRLLARLSDELSPWLKWNLHASLERGDLETRWQATLPSRRCARHGGHRYGSSRIGHGDEIRASRPASATRRGVAERTGCLG